MIHIIGKIYRRLHLNLLRQADNLKQATKDRRKPLFVTSLHKSGTHLLQNCLDALGYAQVAHNRPLQLLDGLKAPKNSYIISHFLPAEDVLCACARGDANIILNIRDPRDIFLSNIDFFDWTRPDTVFESVNFYRNAYREAFEDRHQLAEAILNNRTLGDYAYTLEKQLESCLALYFHPSVLTVKYEDLLISHENSNSIRTVEAICDYLKINQPHHIEELCRHAYTSGSRTMNVAKTQRWKKELDPELLEKFMAKYGHIVHALKY